MAPSTAFCQVVACSALLLIPFANGQTHRILATGDEEPAWTYRRTGPEGEEPYGPSDWHLAWPDCGLDSQSPINISADIETVPKRKNRQKIKFYPNECDSGELTFRADERVWQVNYDACTDTPHLKFEGDKYNLLQIHIHSPSEHTIGGSLHDAEIHWVHVKEGTDAELLVVGVLFDASGYGENVEIERLWQVLDIGEETSSNPFTSSIYCMLPANPSFSHYMGSLTTPPCTEGVKWIVMNDPVLMGRTQLEQYRHSVAEYGLSKVDEFGNTNRPECPLNDRKVYYNKA